MTEFLNPRNDFLFKRLFGVREQEDLLVALINAVFRDSGGASIRSATILNPEIPQDALRDKRSVFDIRVRTDLGQEIDIEVQTRRHKALAVRTLYYWAKLFTQQLSVGDEFDDLHPCVTINVLDFGYQVRRKTPAFRRGDIRRSPSGEVF